VSRSRWDAAAVQIPEALDCRVSVLSLREFCVKRARTDAGPPRNDESRCFAQRGSRALSSRQGGCRFPGCPNKHYVDGHHIEHWADGGETRLSNLALLCRFHHRQVHEGGVAIDILNDGALRFLMKDGRSCV